MKKSIIIVLTVAVSGLLFIAAPCGTSQTKKADPAVVVLYATHDTLSVDNGWDPATQQPICGTGWGYAGMQVVNASSSSNAPTYRLPFIFARCPAPNYTPPPRIDLAQALADLMAQGYHIVQVQNMTYTLARY